MSNLAENILRYYHLPRASSTSLTTQWKECLSFKYSYPHCSTLIQAIDEEELQYDPRFEVPDRSKPLPVLPLKKLVATVTKLNDEPLRKQNQQETCSAQKV